MKKRNVALVLAATMMLSLAGCAGSNEKTEDTKKAQTETENKTEGRGHADEGRTRRAQETRAAGNRR